MSRKRPHDRPSDRQQDRPQERPQGRQPGRQQEPPQESRETRGPAAREPDTRTRTSAPWQTDRKGGQHRSRERGGRAPAGNPDIAILYGYHAVREALRSQHRKIIRVMATEVAAEKLANDIAARNITPEIVTVDAIAQRLPQDAVHQGVLMEARHLADLAIEDLPDNGFILVLDQVTDPHNVGAILRTAAAFGLDGIVTTERHSPAMTGLLAKAASGALEHVPVVSIVNLARALEKLEDRGYLRVGLDSEGPRSLEQEVLSRPLALVLGAEGKGLRRLTRENCDVLARLDMPGPIKSLNVSNACAVALTIARMKLSG